MTTMTRAMLFLICLCSWAGAQGVHRDSELGFQIRPPRGWREMPLLDKEKWIVAKYLDEREYRSKGRFAMSHTPEMKIIVFPKAITEKKDEAPAVEKEDGRIVVTPGRRVTYRSFREYLKRHSQGGYFISQKKETTHRGMDTTFLEIKYEKLTVPRRGWAWIVHDPEADWVVYFEVLEDWWDKLAPECKRSFKTFKFIPRTGSILERHAATTSDDDEKIVIETGDGEGEKKSPEERAAERAKRRKVRFDRAFQRAKDGLPDGWRIMESKNFVAVTHVDARYTKEQLERAEAVREWLDDELGWVSEAEPGRALIRIYEDYEEYRSVWQSSGDAFNTGVEIMTYRDVGKQAWQKERMNTRVTQIWLSDKDFASWGMPPWLMTGLFGLLGTSYVKGGRLVFEPDQWDTRQLRELARNDDLTPPRKLMTMTSRRFAGVPGASTQAAAFMRFLIEGPRSKTKGFLETYIKALQFVVEEERKKEEEEREKMADAELTEEEQEAAEAARFRARKQRERKRIENTFDIAFGEWSEKQWHRFERSYFAFVD